MTRRWRINAFYLFMFVVSAAARSSFSFVAVRRSWTRLRSLPGGASDRSCYSISSTRDDSQLTGRPSRWWYSASFQRRGCRVRPLSSTTSDPPSSASERKKRLLFLGTPDVAATVLRSLCDATLDPECPYEVVGIVTQPAKRRKRKGPVEISPVGAAAEAMASKLPRPPVILCPESARDDSFLSALENDVRPDVCVTAAYGQYLPKRFLELPPHGTLNIHPSLLPRWRGASPVQRSLEAGDNPVGVTVLFTVSKMDAGPIVTQQAVEVGENDSASTVLPMLFEVGTNLLLEALPDVLSGEISMETAAAQRDEDATAARLIEASEAELRVWEESASQCHNRARGFSMWPQTFLTVRVGSRPDLIRLKVLSTRLPRATGGSPSEQPLSRVVAAGPNKSDGLYVTCGDGSILELLVVQPPTRRAFPARDFQNGYPGETIRWVHPSDGGPKGV